MLTKHLKPGFYANSADTFYVTPTGRMWLVASDDDLPAVREVDEIETVDLSEVGSLLTPAECIGYCRQIEAASGEALLTDA